MTEQAIMNHLGGAPNEVDGDWPDRAVTLLTGSGGTSIPSTQYTLNQLAADLTTGKQVTVSTKADDSLFSRLVGGHTYTVIDVDGDMVHLYNPWGPNAEGELANVYIPFDQLVMDTFRFQVR